ncbi:F0F1 ATP synthase subunit delta [Sinimarinibacterium sp. NLF-5-8]|uniref:F0F1 ATP synthase subunit delta n=1 Tax=Sinimarinibacterium sp. NLF-5-8 TaxID=2698684 RepID=UPI00137BDD27|nr:F0F1 ATP synthase subunit delta [Sinimarinibacterium sp. NLF-5-8]QHS10393.1 F0F1 ATP synthase subunit delta [Sinimarinibacterium sp. NLF-5-8]
MADFSTQARPYAKAVFELARDGKSFAEWGETLSALSALVSAPEVANLIGHPALTRAQLGGVLTQALEGKLSAQAVAFARLLVENGRVQALPAIAAEFEQLRAQAEARIDVEITSAAEVPEAQRQQLAAAIGKRLQRQVDISWNTNADLIAGAMIRAGDLIIDGSVRGELDRLQTALTH